MAASGFGQLSDRAPVRKTGPWEDADVDHLIRLWRDGRSNSEIARSLRRQENAVAIKASRLRLPPKSIAGEGLTVGNAENGNAELRPCLTCQKTFCSEGFGHRVCDSCKSTSAWSSGDYAVSYGGSF